MKRRVILPYRSAFRSYGKHYFMEACRQVFEGLGFEATTVDMRRYTGSLLGLNDLVFFMDCVTATTCQRSRSKAFKIYYNMEPTRACPHYPARSEGHLARVKSHRVDAIVDYNGHSTQYWRDNGFDAAYCGLAYHESYEINFPTDDLFPDSVYYLGKEESRRGALVRMIREGGKIPAEAVYLRGHIKAMERLNCSPGVHLNLHRVNCPFQFGGIRVVIMLMSNRRFVLSEPCDWIPEGLTSGVHWEMLERCNAPKMIERAKWWWERPEEREKVGQAGYEFVKAHHRLDVELPAALDELGVL